jgi:hypothetical protein
MFKKAIKSSTKLRCAIYGPAGSGKTYSSLRIANGLAHGLSKRIAVIDTEFGSASKYADKFNFDCAILDKECSIDSYLEAIKAADGYEILIIDSLTHAWKSLLDDVDKISKTQFKGNSFSAWSKGNSKHNALLRAILGFGGHVICTMRSKTEWIISEQNGKSKPERVGLSPEQGKDIEYEFDMLMEISPEHYVHVIKDRTGKFQDKTIDKPGEEFGNELYDWLNTNELKISLEDALSDIYNSDSLDILKDNFEKIKNQFSNGDLQKIIRTKDEIKQRLTTRD